MKCGRERVKNGVYYKASVDKVLKIIYSGEIHFVGPVGSVIATASKMDEILETGHLPVLFEVVYLPGYLKSKNLPFNIDIDDFKKYLESRRCSPYFPLGKKLLNEKGNKMTDKNIYKRAEIDEALDIYIGMARDRELTGSGFVVLENGGEKSETAFTLKIGNENVSVFKSGSFRAGRLVGKIVNSSDNFSRKLDRMNSI